MSKSLMACILALLAPLFCLAQPDADEQRRIAVHDAMKSGMASGKCVPPPQVHYRKGDESSPLEYDLILSAARNSLLLCSMRSAFGQGELTGCWKRDPRSAKVAPYPTPLVPGHSVKGNGCRDFGYCRAKEGQHEERDYELVTLSFDEKTVAVIEQDSALVAIYEAGGKKFLRAFPYRGAALGANGISNNPINAFYTGNHLLIVGADAGPFAAVHRFRDDGVSSGSVYWRGKERFNVYGGETRLRDGTHLVARDRGYNEVVVNAANGSTVVTRLPRPVACTSRQFNKAADHLSGYDEGDPDESAAKQIGAACVKAIMHAKKRFWKPVPFVHQGTRYEVLEKGGARQLIARDLATSKTSQTISLPICGAAQ